MPDSTENKNGGKQLIIFFSQLGLIGLAGEAETADFGKQAEVRNINVNVRLKISNKK